MSRLARLVVPDVPHHVTQRGNGRAQTFFGDADYAFYLELLGRHCCAGCFGVGMGVDAPREAMKVVIEEGVAGAAGKGR